MVPGLPMLHQGFMRMCGKVRGLPECLVGPSHNPHHHPMPRGRSVSTCVHAQLCLILCIPMDSSPPGSSVHGILQGIFPTQGSNPCLLHCRQILHQLSHLGIPHTDPFSNPSFSAQHPVCSQSPQDSDSAGNSRISLHV